MSFESLKTTQHGMYRVIGESVNHTNLSLVTLQSQICKRDENIYGLY